MVDLKSHLPLCTWVVLPGMLRSASIIRFVSSSVGLKQCSQFASEIVSDPEVPDLTFRYINFQPVSIIPNLEVTYLLLQDILALSALGMGPNCIS